MVSNELAIHHYNRKLLATQIKRTRIIYLIDERTDCSDDLLHQVVRLNLDVERYELIIKILTIKD